MQGRAFGTGFMTAIVACWLLMPVSWAQPPKPGGTLRVAYEADTTGLDPHVSFGLQAWVCGGESLQQPGDHRRRTERRP